MRTELLISVGFPREAPAKYLRVLPTLVEVQQSVKQTQATLLYPQVSPEKGPWSQVWGAKTRAVLQFSSGCWEHDKRSPPVTEACKVVGTWGLGIPLGQSNL